jgi:pseudaminic acid synthase
LAGLIILSEHEKASRSFRRSLFVVKDIKAGEIFSKENLNSIRPAWGLHTRYFEEIIGRKAKIDIDRGTPLSWDLIG